MWPRRVEKSAAFSRRKHSDGVICTQSAKICTLQRINGNVYFGKLSSGLGRIISAADFFTDIEHRCLVPFAFTDNDPAAHRHRIHHFSHGLNGDMVRVFPVALAHRFGRFNSGRFRHAQKIER